MMLAVASASSRHWWVGLFEGCLGGPKHAPYWASTHSLPIILDNNCTMEKYETFKKAVLPSLNMQKTWPISV